MEPIEVSMEYGGRTLTLQTRKYAKQADASVLARYGDTVVLVTVVANKDIKENQDFFPLTVDYQEKYYAAGRLPGGFFKREAKPSDRATLSARLIDRPIRPLFPEDFLAETNVVATILSNDPDNDADVVASIATSAALHISDIPWSGPIGTCRVGMLDGEFVTNIKASDCQNSSLELLISGVKTGVVMVEGAAKEVAESVMVDAIDYAHKEMTPLFELIEEFRRKTGSVTKREYSKPVRDESLKQEIKKFLWQPFEKAFLIREKLDRYEALSELKKNLKEKFCVAEPKTKEDTAKNSLVSIYYEELKATFARELTLNSGHRIDGRAYNGIRPIWIETGLLPRAHGSAVFTRGETQVLSVLTLGTSEDEQKVDSISGVYNKAFMLHYNFAPFSVGEARPMRPPGRREIGHGNLAERALSYVIPSKEVFPYTIRLVAETLESNGSSSMATVCSGTLALMDGGVPIPKPVAGVAMGLIKEDEKVAILSDILGDEDHLGDMDFKVCGTSDGVTAFQMDLKIGGVSRQIMEDALAQAREGRIHILEKMSLALNTPRSEFSKYAPRIHTIKVKPEKVREVIGAGGKVIRGIIEQTGVKIDIEDDGSIHIASPDDDSAKKAIEIIQGITAEAEIGKIYEGRVSRIAEFGAFVEIFPGTDGLCHVSELEHYRVRRVEDVVKEGDVIRVKCLDVDSQGKIRLSRKALLPKGGGDDPQGGGSPSGSSEDNDEESVGNSRARSESYRSNRENFKSEDRSSRQDDGGRGRSRDRFSHSRSSEAGLHRSDRGYDRDRNRDDRDGNRSNDSRREGGSRERHTSGREHGGGRTRGRGGDRGGDRDDRDRSHSDRGRSVLGRSDRGVRQDRPRGRSIGRDSHHREYGSPYRESRGSRADLDETFGNRADYREARPARERSRSSETRSTEGREPYRNSTVSEDEKQRYERLERMEQMDLREAEKRRDRELREEKDFERGVRPKEDSGFRSRQRGSGSSLSREHRDSEDSAGRNLRSNREQIDNTNEHSEGVRDDGFPRFRRRDFTEDSDD